MIAKADGSPGHVSGDPVAHIAFVELPSSTEQNESTSYITVHQSAR